MDNQDKNFVRYLRTNKVTVVKGRIKIEDADKARTLHYNYARKNASKRLPNELKPYKDKVITFRIDHCQRESQDPTKFKVELKES